MNVGSNDLRDRIIAAGMSAGLTAVGVCGAEPFEDTREILESRRAQGLSSDMQFTYRNPERSTDPSRALTGARSMIVGAYRYDTAVDVRPLAADNTPLGVAKIARYATADHYDELRRGLTSIATLLKQDGHRAIVVADDNAMVDRAVAVRAGIGWYGKSANVLLPGQGSWFVLGSVITDLELEPTGEPLDDGCGTCHRCIDGCPTGAIIAPGVVDAGRCISWHLQKSGDYPREFRIALGDRIYGCDDCQEVCPPSRRADSKEIGAPADGPLGETWVEIDWLLTASDQELLDRLGRWYIPKRDVRYVRRNALVVFGNTMGGATADHVEVMLAPYLDGDDDLLAAHASWAALQLGLEMILDVGERSVRTVIVEERALHRAEQAAAEEANVLRVRVTGQNGRE